MPNGDYETTQHLVEYITLDVLDWEAALLQRNLSWYLPVVRLARFLCLADGVGLQPGPFPSVLPSNTLRRTYDGRSPM